MFHPRGPTFFELARQALSSTERGYDLLAPKFDFTPFRTPSVILDVVGQQLKQRGPFDRGLDICCGTGAAIEMLGRVCREQIVGLDMSRGMLEVARQRFDEVPYPPAIRLDRGDALQMPYEEEFDLAVSFGAFGHILPADETTFVKQIARSLKPGGAFVFVTHPMFRLWQPAYWLARGFNLAMRVRNTIVRPPFIMYYLTFLLPRACDLLSQQGFEVEVLQPFAGRLAFLRLVIARRVGSV